MKNTKNFLPKDHVIKITVSSKGLPFLVYHINGKTYQTKRSSKGCYIIVDGIRKYIAMDITY